RSRGPIGRLRSECRDAGAARRFQIRIQNGGERQRQNSVLRYACERVAERRRMNVGPALEALASAALVLHKAGRLEEAEAQYRRILAIDSQHLNSLQLLGVL